ncbi:hypothetical protein BaRGS_00023361 [Batillaria attramentaria]|uniref:Uncharacterized protein n=1 Tax=Batillaria attramentaria TaxID=370345 RepID=A0ABD0KE82_9CAEN
MTSLSLIARLTSTVSADDIPNADETSAVETPPRNRFPLCESVKLYRRTTETRRIREAPLWVMGVSVLWVKMAPQLSSAESNFLFL